MNNLHEIIQQYVNEGLSFIPIPYKSKIPTIEWKKYQSVKPTQEEINKWFNGHDTNIAVICGDVSGGLVILDFDKESVFEDFAAKASTKLDQDLLSFTRISKTSRGYHVWLHVIEQVTNQKYPALDIKSNGGYIIAPPSIHPGGTAYKLLNPGVPINTIESLKDVGIDVTPLQQNTKPTIDNPGWVTIALQGVCQEERNMTSFKLAGYFKNIMPKDIATAILLDWNKKNKPPLVEKEIFSTINSAYKYNAVNKDSVYTNVGNSNMAINVTENVTESVTENSKALFSVTDESLSKSIENWLEEQSFGWFTADEIDADLKISTAHDKANRRQVMHRLKEAGEIEQSQKQNKMYRRVNKDVRIINFKAAANKEPMDIQFPFGLENMVNIYPKNIIIIAGAPNAGKTGWLLNLIKMNQDRYEVRYFSSEMGDAELALRLGKFDDMNLEDWNFVPEERVTNFADGIMPDAINIIDFLEIDRDFNEVAGQIRQIYDRLNNGIAVIAIQKNPGSDLGRGGTFSLEKARLYLAMDAGVTTITKAKNWVNPADNPNKKKIEYKIVGGCKFIITRDWYIDAFDKE